MIYHTPGEHANYYTIIVFWCKSNYKLIIQSWWPTNYRGFIMSSHLMGKTKTICNYRLSGLSLPLSRAVLLTCHFVLRKLNTESSIGASYWISINLVKRLWRRFFLFFWQSKTRTAYGGHISCMISMKYWNFAQDLPYIIPTK